MKIERKIKEREQREKKTEEYNRSGEHTVPAKYIIFPSSWLSSSLPWCRNSSSTAQKLCHLSLSYFREGERDKQTRDKETGVLNWARAPQSVGERWMIKM